MNSGVSTSYVFALLKMVLAQFSFVINSVNLLRDETISLGDMKRSWSAFLETLRYARCEPLQNRSRALCGRRGLRTQFADDGARIDMRATHERGAL